MNRLPIDGKNRETSRCGLYTVGLAGVSNVVSSIDGSADFILMDEGPVLANVYSGSGYMATYRLPPAHVERPIRAVLMDLDGTTVKSEGFWMRMIEKTVSTMLNEPGFLFSEIDIPYVCGHSISEHLSYCIDTYIPTADLASARRLYLDTTREELSRIEQGEGREDSGFLPTPGIREFLLSLKGLGLKIALVTSGTYEKAWPEIQDCFAKLDLGDPARFYELTITAGSSLFHGGVGTMGELTPKPHPWLYAEAACIGLGIPKEQRHQVVGIEDSSAGILALRLAGFSAIGLRDGNIEAAGYRGLCSLYTDSLDEILQFISQEM